MQVKENVLSLSLSLFLSVSMRLLCAAEHAAQRHKQTWWIRQEIVRLAAEIYKANMSIIVQNTVLIPSRHRNEERVLRRRT